MRLPGGRAFDYATHILTALKEVADTYADFTQMSRVTVKEIFLSKIKSCLSDRAPVNHFVIELLKQDINVELLELHCNVHPLDGIATASKKALMDVDKELKIKTATGKEGSVVSFLYNLSKLRYSFKGEPAAFKSFLREHGVAPGTFLHYVGNRIHVIFHMAGVAIFHLQLLKSFLQKHNKNVVSSFWGHR